MTLVAAWRSADVPILLGDFLLSDGDKRWRGQKKISRIRSTLAIGWTGSRVHAAAALRRMTAELDEHPSRDGVGKWLESYDAELAEGQILKLVGWVGIGRESRVSTGMRACRTCSGATSGS